MPLRSALRATALSVLSVLVLASPTGARADAQLEPAPSQTSFGQDIRSATLPGTSHGSGPRRHAHPDHVDPAPPGVNVHRKPSTTDLLRRLKERRARKAGQSRSPDRGASAAGHAASSDPDLAAAPVPAGASALPGLTGHVPRSCAGTGTDGNRVQVLYVVQSNTKDRFEEVLPVLRDEVANVDDTFALSAAETGGFRRVRWVFASPTTCEPVIDRVVVPAGSLSSFGSSVQALRTAGYTNPRRKYLVFADAAAFCGVGHIYRDDSPVDNANDGNAQAMFARVDTGCWQASSTHGSTAAHELMHNLGGVQSGAPHATAYGHCTDEYDLMCYDDGSGSRMNVACATSHRTLFDCRHDDYFDTAPEVGSYLATRWNAADSSFLDGTPPASAEEGASEGPPTVSVSGPTAARPGLAARLIATGSAAGTFTWSVSAPDCVAGSTTTPILIVRCSADHEDAVTAAVTFLRSDGAVATATHTVAPVATRATLTQTASGPSRPLAPRAMARVTAKLLGGTAAVRGRVHVSTSTDAKTWRTIASGVDTGADGQVVLSLRPTRSTYVRINTRLAPGSTWSPTRAPVVLVRVARAAATLTMAARAGEPALVRARLVDTGTSQPLARRVVALQYRAPGSRTWRTTRTLRTGTTGRVAVVVRPGRGTVYRWRYGGSPTYLPRISASAYLS